MLQWPVICEPGLLEGQEDCLYINVYRPEEREAMVSFSVTYS